MSQHFARPAIGCGILLTLLALVALPSCKQPASNSPPPDVRRPVLKSENELASERAERVARGEIVPTSGPASAPTSRPATVFRTPTVRTPEPGAIEPDILLVNDAVLTVAEVLYPLRDQLAELRQKQTRAGYREEARRLIRRGTQQEIGTILIYGEARSKLEEQQRKTLDTVVDKELEKVIQREFGGSPARFVAHLKANGLTREKYRDAMARMLIVREFTREQLMPQVRVARSEILRQYREDAARYSTPETRELLLIELPFEKFVADGRPWDAAGATERAQAKLKAVRRGREAAEALQQRPFEEVAREFSLGSHAEAGGSWGAIAKPLQAPYDKLSQMIFEHEEGWTSEPIETEAGWYIVRCGRITPPTQQPFTEVQAGIRKELEERQFNRKSTEYVLKLAENATISSLDAFINAALQRAEKLTANAARAEGAAK